MLTFEKLEIVNLILANNFQLVVRLINQLTIHH